MKKLVLVACAVAGLIIPAWADDVPTYRLGQSIKFTERAVVTVDDIVIVGFNAEHRTIKVLVSSSLWDFHPLVELEDKQGNRWTATEDQNSVVFFDVPDNPSDLTILLFRYHPELSSFKLYAKVATSR